MSRIKAKYETLGDVKKAIDSGILSKDVTVTLDNDHSSIHILDTNNQDDLIYIWHGDDPYACAEQALDALEMLYQMSLPANASMPPELVRKYIAKSVHVVVFAGRRNVPDGAVTKVVRRIEQICLIKGVKDGEYDFENVA